MHSGLSVPSLSVFVQIYCPQYKLPMFKVTAVYRRLYLTKAVILYIKLQVYSYLVMFLH